MDATIGRDSAAAIGLVLGVLYLFPIAAAVFSSSVPLARHLDQIGPLPAGLDAQTTTGINSLPLTPWQGLGVVALWTAGAVLLAAQRASAAAAYTGSSAISIIRAVRRRGRLPALRIAAITVAAVAMAFVAVACSSSGPGSTPDAGSSPVTTAQLVKFARCMRAHDVKNFPDPVNGGFSFSGVGPDSVDPSSPAFQAAKGACIHLVPGEAQRLTVTAQDLAAGDKLAACMRSHGFPSFPDPTSQNVFDVPKSINIALPSYQSAFSTCQSQAHDNNGVFPGAAKSGQGS